MISESLFPLIHTVFYLHGNVKLIVWIDDNVLLYNHTINTEFNIVRNSFSSLNNTQILKNVPVCAEERSL